LVGTVGTIKYFLKTEESYFIDETGKKVLTFMTKEESDEQFKKWEANPTLENLPKYSVCAGLPMDATGKDFPVTVDTRLGEIKITIPSEKQTTTFVIEKEESLI
jgi:hypothetical protein